MAQFDLVVEAEDRLIIFVPNRRLIPKLKHSLPLMWGSSRARRNVQISPFPVLNALGSVLAAFAALMLVPALYSWAEGDGAVWDFLYSVGITFAAGTILFFHLSSFSTRIDRAPWLLLVTLSWTLTSAFATIPLLLNQPQYNFSELYFETVSCITTTGSTVITGLDSLPPSINGWRCFLSWVGGMGLIVFSVAILPLLGIGGAQLMKAETSGPMKETRLTPRVAETARALYIIYLEFPRYASLPIIWPV